jgi:hypothetical protein
MDAPDAGGGTVTTRPIQFTGNHLFVNAAIPSDGELTAEVLDEATARVMEAITTMLSGIRSAQTGSQKA